MAEIPAFKSRFFRVAEPAEHRFDAQDLYNLLPIDQKKVYDFEEIPARLVDNSESMAFRPIEPIIEKMNKIADDYKTYFRPKYCAEVGYVDEIVKLTEIRNYMVAFTVAAYQNPTSICPRIR